MTVIQERRPSAEARADGFHSVAAAVGAATRRAVRRPTSRRQNVVLTLAATVLGLWFGLGAPAVSPVAPPVPAVSSPALIGQADAPADTAGPADPLPPAGRGRGDGQFGRLDAFDQQGRRR
ncbi:hypothetical protein [Friedmanniella luteola]|uniref:hypothetical protein n=1 Tax=Friedmanniella luteola TaxID=546871 RepID=UPI0012FDEF16|nr:hypothetical protein [Friedmanniella luteola]